MSRIVPDAGPRCSPRSTLKTPQAWAFFLACSSVEHTTQVDRTSGWARRAKQWFSLQTPAPTIGDAVRGHSGSLASRAGCPGASNGSGVTRLASTIPHASIGR